MANNWLFRILTTLFFCISSVSSFSLAAWQDDELPFDNAEITISLDVQNASLNDILKLLSIQSGLNFIATESVQDRRVTLYLDNVPIKDAVNKIFKANNLSYELDRSTNIFIVKDWGKPKRETITRIFPLKYASVSSSQLLSQKGATLETATGESGGSSSTSGEAASLKDILTKNLSDLGFIVEDARTNSLIITDVPNQMPLLAQIVHSLDMPQPQVMLEVEMLDVSKEVVDKMGINFEAASKFGMKIIGAKAETLFPWGAHVDNADRDTVLGKTFTPGNITVPDLDMFFQFLRKTTDTKFLARPRILTLNNETAEISIITDEAVGEKVIASKDAGTTSTEAERFETGVSLKITPQINTETGEITLCLLPSVAEASQSGITSSTGVKFYNPETRSTKSMLRVKDGDTIIVGGLIRSKTEMVESKLPFLGDIPVAGALFRHKAVEPNKERELLVFITPRIIKDHAYQVAQTKRSSLPMREQNTPSDYDRFATVSSHLTNFELKQR